MEYRLQQTLQGWLIIRVDGPEADSGARCAGPFPLRPDAIMWIQARGKEAEREEQQQAADARTEALSDSGLARALKEAIREPPKRNR